ncbi:MAG: AAA family ATPase [Suipraeoptans sp.]
MVIIKKILIREKITKKNTRKEILIIFAENITTMLIRLLFKNFLSFYEGTEFNMLPNPKRKRFPKHIYDKQPIPILKASAIYGANGAGKSNIIKGISLLKDFATDKKFFQEVDFYEYRFQLKENNKAQPISIGIEFSNLGNIFYYHVDIRDKKIEVEELYYTNKSTNVDIPIFIAKHLGKQRVLKVYDINGEELANYIDDKMLLYLEKNPYSSIISLQEDYPLVKNSLVNCALEWFNVKLKILPLGFKIKPIINVIDRAKGLSEFINKNISEMSIGIDSVSVKTTAVEDIFTSSSTKHSFIREMLLKDANRTKNSLGLGSQKDRPLFSICKEKGRDVVKELIFTHKGVDGFIGELDVDDQSEGTISLL